MNHTVIHTFVFQIHMGARIFVGASFLLVAAANATAALAIMQLLLFLFVLVNLKSGFQALRKSISLLRWLIIPTVILHALFTPGELIVSGMAVPVSIEGLQSGLWFSLHLTVIFFAAIVFSRLLTNGEWMRVILNIPLAGEKILPYAVLMERGRGGMQTMLHDELSEWRRHGTDLRHLVIHLVVLPAKALNQCREHAHEVWNNWERYSSAIMNDEPGRSISMFATMVALAAGAFMWWLFLSGGFQ